MILLEFFDDSKPIDKRQIQKASIVGKFYLKDYGLGTQILLNKLSKSMSRPKSNNRKVCEQYNGVALTFKMGNI
jgi:hypothetical protein